MVEPAPTLPPISADDPCGPDLDLADDANFLNYLAAAEGQMPKRFFNTERPELIYEFDRKSIDMPGVLEAGSRLLTRTHDLRLVVLLATLNALNRDLAGFSRWVQTIAWLLEAHWEDVHPRADGGDYSNRLAQLQTLNDSPLCVLPLQYAPLVATRRDGAIVYRAQMIALGEAKLREGEALASPGAIDRILATVEPEALRSAFDVAEGLRNALTRIHAVSVERLGPNEAIRFDALSPLIDKIVEFLRAAATQRDPTLAPPADDAGADPSLPTPAETAAKTASSLDTFEDIDAALGAALGYFATREPSSPALLLIAQAREALGKNLYDVMRLLAPSHAEAARVFVGAEGAFTVPVSSLSSAPALAFSRAEAQAAATRADALALVDAVGSHMRRVEPSSPLPYLLDRARALASRDFLSLLHEVLPEDNLDSMKQGR